MTAAQPDLFTRRVRRAPPALEVRTHVAVADTLRRFCEPDWLWTHIGHGGYRTKATAGLLKRMGLRPGWPDFVLVSPNGAHHYLELKAGAAPLSPEQRTFAKAMAARGVQHAVARSYAEAIGQLQRWGAIGNRVHPQ